MLGGCLGWRCLRECEPRRVLAEAEGRGFNEGDGECAAIIDVVGEHSRQTMVPILSQTGPAARVEGNVLEVVVNRVRFGGREVYHAKEGSGSATLSTAYAVLRFTDAVRRGLLGEIFAPLKVGMK